LTDTIPSASAAAIVAAIVLETGSSVRGDLLFLLGLPLTLVAFAIAARGAWTIGDATGRSWLPGTGACLSMMATVGLVTSFHAPAWYEVLRCLVYAGGIVSVGILTSGNRRARRHAVSALIVSATVLHLVTPLALPHPLIDVWSWTQTSVRALLHGVHPYRAQAPDELQGAFNYGYALTVYPYMPATLIVYAPVVALMGDFRFLLAACVPLTIALVRATGHRLRAKEIVIDAITLAILLHPRGLSLTAFGWTEPLLLLVVAAFVYLVVRAPEGPGQATAFFLLPALKQYVIAPVVLYLVMKPPRPPLRAAVVGLTVAAATIVPLLWWDWRPTLAGIVFQMIELKSPRLDSDSLVALSGVTTGYYPDRWWSVIVQFVTGGFWYWRLRRTGAAGLLLASALTLFATFLFGWQAFPNYYYFVAGLLLLGALVLAEKTACSEKSCAR